VAALPCTAELADAEGGYERVLQWGIHAGSDLGDWRHVVQFLDRLGVLLFARGRWDEARHAWAESLHIAEAEGQPDWQRQPLAHLTMLTCTLGEYAGNQYSAEIYLPSGALRGALRQIA
jgi:hypothetical protein